MQISLKYAAAFSAAALLIGLACGRFAAPTKVVTKTATVHDVQIVDHSRIVRVTEKRKDGTTLTTITTQKNIDDTSHLAAFSSHVVERGAPKWIVSGLVGGQVQAGALPYAPIWGASVQYRIGGPFFIGVQGVKLESGALGMASVGIQF